MLTLGLLLAVQLIEDSVWCAHRSVGMTENGGGQRWSITYIWEPDIDSEGTRACRPLPLCATVESIFDEDTAIGGREFGELIECIGQDLLDVMPPPVP